MTDSIKKEKQSVFALKLDLSKAYDRVSWTFIRLVLIKLGMNMEVVEWILGCIQSTSFAVLINGSPSDLFRPSRGIRQGFPLSPFIFILVSYDLSRLITKSRTKGRIIGVKVSGSKEVTHTLFVDDVFLFGNCSAKNGQHFLVICGISHEILGQVKLLFSYQMESIEKCFKFLGYFM